MLFILILKSHTKFVWWDITKNLMNGVKAFIILKFRNITQ